MVSSLLWLWEQRFINGTSKGNIVHLSGLGDSAYYESFTNDDFHQAVLFFAQKPKGSFRRSDELEPREDGSMLRLATENSGKYVVYTEAQPKTDEEGRKITRYFLKAGEGMYVEFGERNHWPAFERVKP